MDTYECQGRTDARHHLAITCTSTAICSDGVGRGCGGFRIVVLGRRRRHGPLISCAAIEKRYGKEERKNKTTGKIDYYLKAKSLRAWKLRYGHNFVARKIYFSSARSSSGVAVAIISVIILIRRVIVCLLSITPGSACCLLRMCLITVLATTVCTQVLNLLRY